MRAVVIGNIARDETFRLVEVPRAGETRLATAVSADLGGKGANQGLVLARCGIPTRLVARIGTDSAGRDLRVLLAAEPLDITGLIDVAEPTDRSMVLVDGRGANCIISTAWCAQSLTMSEATDALSPYGRGDVLLVQGNLTTTVTGHALRLARARGVRTVFNPAPVAEAFAAFWPLTDLVVVNETEAEQLTGTADPAEAALRIRAAGAGCVVVTLGARGALLYATGQTTHEPAAPAAICDTTGAGDTFLAVLTAALFGRDAAPSRALRAAAQAAALTIARAGTLASFPTPAELAAILAACG
jgi:ribokinase